MSGCVESEIRAHLRWVSVAGISEKIEGGDSEYRVHGERDCQILE